MKRKNSFLVSVLLIQFFSLFSNESSSDGNNSRSNTAHIEMHSNNYQNPQSLGHCCVYVALEKPKYHSPERRVSDTLGRCSFSELTRFFDKVIMSVMCIA